MIETIKRVFLDCPLTLKKQPLKKTAYQGRVYWITGLAGSGKTTLSKNLYEELKKTKDNLVWLDGDELREIFQNTGYTLKDRLELSTKYSKLCQRLSSQGLDVICSTISMFDSIRDFNKKNIPQYTEIFIKVPLDILNKRDQKSLYTQFKNQEISHILGLDLLYEEPKNPDLIIEDNGDKTPQEIFSLLATHLNLDKII